MRIKLDKLDKVFSQLVRERAGWRCERCGSYFPEGRRQGLHCSHIFGRVKKSTRWSELNCVAHCHGCHRYLTANPVEFTAWAEAHLGAENFAKLRVQANQPTRINDAIKAQIYADLKAELATMLAARKAGNHGRIEFEGFNG